MSLHGKQLGEVRQKPTRSLGPLDSPLNNNRHGLGEASRNLSPSPGFDGRTSAVDRRPRSSPRGSVGETSGDRNFMTSVGPGVASTQRKQSRSPAPNEMLISVGPGLQGLAPERPRSSHRSSSRGGRKDDETLESSQSMTSIGPGLDGISSRNRSSSRGPRSEVNAGETDQSMTRIGPGLGSLSRDAAGTKNNDSFKSGKSAIRASHGLAGMVESGQSALSSLRSEFDMPPPATEVSAVKRPSSAARSLAPASLENGPGSLSSLRREIHDTAMEGLPRSRSPSLLRGYQQTPVDLDDSGSDGEKKKKKKNKKEKKEKKKIKKENKAARDRDPNSSSGSSFLQPVAPPRSTRPMSAGARNKNSSPMPPKQDLRMSSDIEDEDEDTDKKTKTKEKKVSKKDKLLDSFDDSASLQSSNFSDLDGGGSVMMQDHAHAKNKKKKNKKSKHDRTHEEDNLHGDGIFEDSASISDFIPAHLSKAPQEKEQPHNSLPAYSKDNTPEALDCSIARTDGESDSLQEENAEDKSLASPRLLSPKSSIVSDEDPADLKEVTNKTSLSPGSEVAPQQVGHVKETVESERESSGKVEGSNGFAPGAKVGDRKISIARFLISFVPPTIAAEVETDLQKNVFRAVLDTKLSFLAASGNSTAGIQYLAGKILEDDFGLTDDDPESGHWRDMRRQVEVLLHRLVAKGLPVFRVIHSQGAEVTKALESDPSGERFLAPRNALVLARERRRRPDGWWIRLAAGGGWLHEVAGSAEVKSERVRFAQRCDPSADEVRSWQKSVGKITPVANGNVLARNVAAVAKQMGLHSKKES